MKIWIEKDCVIVRIAYDKNHIAELKKIGQGRWEPNRQVWIFPESKYSHLLAYQARISAYERSKPSYVKPGKLKAYQGEGDTVSRMKQFMTQSGYSPKTIKAYVNHINRYLQFSEGAIEEANINNYMVDLLENKACSHTYCNQAINAIKLYIHQLGIDHDGILKIVRPKKEKKLPKVLSKEEIKRLFAATDNIKHKTALMLGYSCGMRVGEVSELKVNDIHFERNVIHIVQGKGRKDRQIPLSIKMAQQLHVYMKVYRPQIWLFENPAHDGPLSARSLQKVFVRKAADAKIRRHATFHSLRHSYATHLMESGVDIRIIQELLGHASSKTTEIYTHVSQVAMQNIVNPLDDM